MCIISIKVPIRKKSGNLFNDPRIYIYIYIYKRDAPKLKHGYENQNKTLCICVFSLKVKIRSLSGDSDFFDIVVGVLQGNTLAPYLFII